MKLSGEAAVDKITLDGVRGLRVTLSATVHDVLYYMSPIYCQDIIDSVWLLRTFVVISVSIFSSLCIIRLNLFNFCKIITYWKRIFSTPHF